MTKSLTITGIGDISFEGKHTDESSPAVFSSIDHVFKSSDLVIVNLESPLVREGVHISGKCSLHGDPGWAKVMKEAGIHLVSLANNHMMDYGEAGLVSTMEALDSAGVNYVGAGRDKEEACAPLFINIKENRIAFLARTSVIVTSPSYAGTKQPGVAYLDIEETKQKIRMCKNQADIVLLLMHWGLEDYSYPSPDQRQMAIGFIDSGADLILGSHPHVLQGVEFIKNGLVAYSLGNILFDEFEWTLNVSESETKKFFSPLSRENREGMILNLAWDKDRRPELSPIFTRIDEDAKIQLDLTSNRDSHFKKLSKKFGHPFYQYWWHIYAAKKEWHLRIKPKVSFKNIIPKIHKLRIKHIKELFRTLHKSVEIAAGKSTNPYD